MTPSGAGMVVAAERVEQQVLALAGRRGRRARAGAG